MKRSNNLKFFIVDDDSFSRSLYQQHLINLGYNNNNVFDNGYDCLKKLNLQPDIIFMDYDMHPLNGIEVLQRIKQFNPNIYLLMISSNRDTEIMHAAMKYGAYDYITKGERDLEMISNVIQQITLQYNQDSVASKAQPF